MVTVKALSWSYGEAAGVPLPVTLFSRKSSSESSTDPSRALDVERLVPPRKPDLIV